MESFLLLVFAVIGAVLLTQLWQRLRNAEQDISGQHADQQRLIQALTQLQRENLQLQRDHSKQAEDQQQLRDQLRSLQRELDRLRQSPPPLAAPAPPPRPAPAEPPAPLTPPVVAPTPPVAAPAGAVTLPAAAPAVAPPVSAPPVTPPAPVPPVAAPAPAVPAPQPTPAPAAPTPTTPPVTAPTPAPATPAPTPRPVPVAAAAPAVAATTPPAPPAASPKSAPPVAAPPQPPAPPRPVPPRPQPAPVPAEPTWWDRVGAAVLENWTGILGAVVLVTGVGFLGIYAALRIEPMYRFGLINLFALSLIGAELYLRRQSYGRQLAAWLESSAAAIFLFSCVGAVSIPGLRWAGPGLGYALLFAGAAVNLTLAWRSSREAVATLHGLLTLVALAVLPPTLLTLAASAAVTAFSIGITYRQRWRFQLLLSILSFFAFHLYWHSQLMAPVPSGLRLGAIGLVLLVGLAAAVVQYRRVYATGAFEPLLFAAHLLNWTCLGINLYLHSTGSVWKTIPLGLGAVLTFFVARHARRLGIQWLFQTDTVISLALALATAFSLQGWHASSSFILVLMLLEVLLVAFIMAREGEALVFQIAATGALLASGALLLLNLLQLPDYTPIALYRNAALLAVAATTSAVYFHLTTQLPLFGGAEDTGRHRLLHSFGGMVAALYVGPLALLLRALLGQPQPPYLWLMLAAAAGAAGVLLLAQWLRGGLPWFRQLHLLVAQALLLLALLGLHPAGLSWAATFLVLFAETLLATLLLGRFGEELVQRIVGASGLLMGLLLVLPSSFADLPALAPPLLYRRALWLLLAAGLTAAFSRLTDDARPTARYGRLPLLQWQLGGALTGLLCLGLAGLLLYGFFGPLPVAAWPLLAATTAAAGGIFGLAWWLRGGTPWLRLLHLLAGQGLLTVAALGLHAAGLAWSSLLLVLFLETLLLALLLGRAAELLAQRIVGVAALLTGALLLVPAFVHLPTAPAASLYRRALWLLLAAVGGTIFSRLTDAARNGRLGQLPAAQWQLGGALTAIHYVALVVVLLFSFFGFRPVAAGGLLGATTAAAGAVFGLSQWLRGGSTGWLRVVHLLAGQALLMVAALGLHEIGLSWPAATLVLYLETLLMTLLLAVRRELPVYAVLLRTTLLLTLPLVAVAYLAPGQPQAELRAALLLSAALATTAAQLWLSRQPLPAYDDLPLSFDSAYRLRLLGMLAGLLPLAAAGLVYHHGWSVGAMVLVGSGLLLLRRTVPVPGLWLGVLLSVAGYQALQYAHVAPAPLGRSVLGTLAYLLPTALLPLVGLAASGWAIRQRHVRWPWLYLLGLHLLLTVWLVWGQRSDALPGLLWTLLAVLAFAAARLLAPRLLTDEARQQAGQPDRYLLHLSYLLLVLALGWHFGPALHSPATYLGWPVRRFTAAALLLALGGLGSLAPPAAAPYRSWRLLHPWLPELTLLLLLFTLRHETASHWHALWWVALALGLQLAAPRLPLRLRRVGLYGLPLFWLAALHVGYVALRYLHPGAWLGAPWLASAGAVALLFVFAAFSLQTQPTAPADLAWPPGLAWLGRLGRLRPAQLIPLLLYPAFVALTVLLLRSFDRSVLTVLLMLDVMGVFVASLLLRRRDLRYAALIGIGLCMVRLVFFDLRQRGTLTQAVVFILMGLLLLGMNALYARFKTRFVAPTAPPDDSAPAAEGSAAEPLLPPDEPDPAPVA